MAEPAELKKTGAKAPAQDNKFVAALKNIDLKGLKDRVLSLVSGPKDVIGVDIGSHSVKLVALKPAPGGPTLAGWAVLPIESKGEASPEEKQQQIVAMLKSCLLQKGIKIQHAAASVSGNAVIVRYVKFPLLTKNELRATLATEAEPFIPFDINEVQLSFHILNEVIEEGQKKMETVLVAAKKDAVNARVEALKAANLKPTIIDVDAFALENVYERIPDAANQLGSALYLNIGHLVTNLSIIENGMTRVVRDVFISGNTFTKAIMKALQYDLAKAEEVKKANGLLIDAEEKEKALQEGNRDALGVSQAVATVMKDLVAEIHRSVDFFLAQGPERSIGRIVLSGGSASLKNISKFMTGELKVPVSVLDPLVFVKGVPPELPAELRPALGVAVGLALRSNRDWL